MQQHVSVSSAKDTTNIVIIAPKLQKSLDNYDKSVYIPYKSILDKIAQTIAKLMKTYQELFIVPAYTQKQLSELLEYYNVEDDIAGYDKLSIAVTILRNKKHSYTFIEENLWQKVLDTQYGVIAKAKNVHKHTVFTSISEKEVVHKGVVEFFVQEIVDTIK